jgi:hypothetical protein
MSVGIQRREAPGIGNLKRNTIMINANMAIIVAIIPIVVFTIVFLIMINIVIVVAATTIVFCRTRVGPRLDRGPGGGNDAIV